LRTGIIIQARTGSTRLPNKVLLPFYKDQSILDILIDRITSNFHLPLVLATSDLVNDDPIEVLCQRKGIACYRGDETNVLKRFMDCAMQYQFDTIIRICADNPFLDMALIEALLSHFDSEQMDYLSFVSDEQIPAMKTHIGVFTEMLKLSALQKTFELTNDKLYTEHVTNFIYANPEIFHVHWLEMPDFLLQKKIRLTLDSKEDFDVLKELYINAIDNDGSIVLKNVIKQLLQDDHKLQIMNQQIEKFSK
jgi:spore coat polysaccharide biosynthesis protein SpsF (cytidylyltransferase family)